MLFLILAQTIHLSYQKKYEIKSKQKKMEKQNAFKLIFNNFDFKESRYDVQVQYMQTKRSSLIKDYVKYDLQMQNEMSKFSKVFLKTIRLIINIVLLGLGIYLNKLQLEVQDSKIVYCAVMNSVVVISISEVLKWLIRNVQYYVQSGRYGNELGDRLGMEYYSTLVLVMYHIVSEMNIIYTQNQTIYFPTISHSNYITLTQYTSRSQSILNPHTILCPELILTYRLLIFAAIYYISSIIIDTLPYIFFLIKQPLSRFIGIQFTYHSSQQFNFYSSQKRDHIFFLLILINQPFFAFSIIMGLILFAIKSTINLYLLKNSKILNYTRQESFIIQKSVISNLNVTLITVLTFYFYLSTQIYGKYVNNKGQICGLLDENSSISLQINKHILGKFLIGQLYSLITWQPFIWMLFGSYIVKQWIDKSSKKEWENQNENQAKMMKEINKHYQNKIEDMEDRIDNTKINIKNSELHSQFINRSIK